MHICISHLRPFACQGLGQAPAAPGRLRSRCLTLRRMTIQEAAMTSANRPTDQATSIQLRPEDLDFLSTQVSDPGLHTRNVAGFANNLTPGRAFWGSAEQPFL